MFEICVSGEFRASHQLQDPFGTLERAHEHFWRVKVTYAGPELSRAGVLLDFTILRSDLNSILAPLDHQNLNRLPAFADRTPSAEYVARYIADRLQGRQYGQVRLKCVEVEEEPGCFARCYPDYAD